MDERIKSLFYMAVGVASTSQKAKQVLEKFNIEGRLTEEEGKRIIDEIFESSSHTADNLKAQVKQYLNEILSELETPSQHAFKQLEERVAKLEAKLKEKQG